MAGEKRGTALIRDESDTSTRLSLDTLRIEYAYEDRLLGDGDTYP